MNISRWPFHFILLQVRVLDIFPLNILRDSRSFGDVNPTIFAHWVVCTIQFHIDDVELIILHSCCGHRFSKFVRPSSFYQRPFVYIVRIVAPGFNPFDSRCIL